METLFILPAVAIVTGVLKTCHVEGLYRHSMTPELSLLQYLMSNYDTNVRPVKNTSEAIVVTLDIALTQIVDVKQGNIKHTVYHRHGTREESCPCTLVNVLQKKEGHKSERHQTITTSVWLRFSWEDYFLKWNETDYGGVKIVHLKPADVWVPDITLYTDVTGKFYETEEFRVKVSSNGTVGWTIPVLFTSTCKMNVLNFPYDVQTCRLKFGSWGFSSNEIDLQNKSDSADLSSYESNAEWELLSVDAEHHVVKYNCCGDTYTDVTYYINIKRMPLYYIFNVALPIIFILLISPFSFLVSPGSGERIQLSVTLFLSLTVYMLFVAEQLPVQSDNVPLIGQFFTVALLALAVLNVASITSVHFFHRGSKRDILPRMAKHCFIKVAKLVCMGDRFGEMADTSCYSMEHGTFTEIENNLELERCDQRVHKIENEARNPSKGNCLTSRKYKENTNKGTTSGESNETRCNIVQLVHDINTKLSKFQDFETKSQRVDGIKREWKMVALVMDRCLFILSSIFTVSFSLCFALYQGS